MTHTLSYTGRNFAFEENVMSIILNYYNILTLTCQIFYTRNYGVDPSTLAGPENDMIILPRK